MITLPFLPRYRILFTDRHDGSFRAQAAVDKFLSPLAGDQQIVFMQLEHGSRRVFYESGENTVKGDTLLTTDKNAPAMVVGDCFPIIIIDPKHHLLAMIHGGWRSLLQNIIELTCIDFTKYGGDLSQSYAWIGPGIRSCCNTSAQPPIQAQFSEWHPFISLDKKQYHVDLPQFILTELQRNGLLAPNIFDYGVCTSCQKEHFFSHRRAVLTGDEDGRCIVSVLLEKKKSL